MEHYGVLVPASRFGVVITYDAQVTISPRGEQINVAAKGHNRAEFRRQDGTLIFYAIPSRPTENGFLKSLKDVDFFQGNVLIASVIYPTLHAKPVFRVGDEVLQITNETSNKEEVFSSNAMKWMVPFNSVEATFSVSVESLVYPCIGFLHYCWSVRWGPS